MVKREATEESNHQHKAAESLRGRDARALGTEG